jgi:hypothetical protein
MLKDEKAWSEIANSWPKTLGAPTITRPPFVIIASANCASITPPASATKSYRFENRV